MTPKLGNFTEKICRSDVDRDSEDDGEERAEENYARTNQGAMCPTRIAR